MRKRTIRLLLKWSLLVNILIFALAVLDYSLWDSQGIWAILALYAFLLVSILVLLVIDERPGFRRMVFSQESESKTIIYGKR